MLSLINPISFKALAWVSFLDRNRKLFPYFILNHKKILWKSYNTSPLNLYSQKRKFRGVYMKKYVYFTLFTLLLALIVGAFAGSQNGVNTSQARSDSPQNPLRSAYQDIAWGANVQKHLKILNSDMNGVSSAINTSDYNTLTVYAQYIVNDTQKAIEENDQYTLSSKLQDAQKEWRAALEDYNSAGQFLLQGANEAKNGTGGTENFQKAGTFRDSGTAHLKNASELAGIT